MTDEQLKNQQLIEVQPNEQVPVKQPPPPFTRTHGFYSKVLTVEEQAIYDQAMNVEGMDTEIALLRVKILSIIAHDPDNIKLLTYATNALARLLMTKYNITKTDKPGVKEAVLNVFRDVAFPLGIAVTQFLKK